MHLYYNKKNKETVAVDKISPRSTVIQLQDRGFKFICEVKVPGKNTLILEKGNSSVARSWFKSKPLTTKARIRQLHVAMEVKREIG